MNRSFPAFHFKNTSTEEEFEQQKKDLIEWSEEHLQKDEMIEFIHDAPYHVIIKNGEAVDAVPIKEDDWLVLITPEKELIVFPDKHIRQFFIIE